MDKKEFKKALENVLGQYGFKYYSQQKTYYHFSNDLITAVDIQKSDYADYYYINYGFRIVEPEDTVKFPKVHNGCDVSARFVFDYKNGKKADGILYIDILNIESFSDLASKFIEKEILPVIEKGINELFIIDHTATNRFNLRGKRLLGLPE